MAGAEERLTAGVSWRRVGAIMAPRRSAILGAAVLLAALVGSLLLRSWREPRYQGRTPQRWLEKLAAEVGDPTEATLQAIPALGEDLFPAIRAALRRVDSPLVGWRRELGQRLGWSQAGPIRDYQWRASAMCAAGLLGSRALPLLPELLDAMCAHQPPDAHYPRTLASLGASSLPFLLEALERRPPCDAVDWAIFQTVRAILEGNDVAHGLQTRSLELCQARLQRVDQQGAEVTVSVALLIRSLNGQAGFLVEDMLAALGKSDETEREILVFALGAFDEQAPRVVPVLGKLCVSDPATRVRRTAASGLKQFPAHAEEAVPALTRALGDSDWAVQGSALTSLTRFGAQAEEAAAAVIGMLRSPRADVRVRAARALGAIHCDARLAIEPLAAALRDEASAVRLAAAQSLGRFGPRAAAAVPALSQALGENPEHVQITVIQALGRIGRPARTAAPQLRAAWNNNQSALGRDVQAALAEIEAGDSP